MPGAAHVDLCEVGLYIGYSMRLSHKGFIWHLLSVFLGKQCLEDFQNFVCYRKCYFLSFILILIKVKLQLYLLFFVSGYHYTIVKSIIRNTQRK